MKIDNTEIKLEIEYNIDSYLINIQDENISDEFLDENIYRIINKFIQFHPEINSYEIINNRLIRFR